MNTVISTPQPLPPKSIQLFDALVIDQRHTVKRWQLEGLFSGEFSGLHMPGALDNPAHMKAVWEAHMLGQIATRSTQYAGTATDLSASGGPSHWEPSYPNGNTSNAWAQYFHEKEKWDYEQKKVFSSCPNPEDLLKAPFVALYGKDNVSRLIHPRYGQEMSPFILRSGYASRHVDNALWDVPVDCVGHVGAVLVLDSDEDTVQRIHRHRPSNPVYAGDKQGNYGLDVPPATPCIDVPSVAGSYNLVSAEYTHELMSHLRRKCRLTIAAHFILTKFGKVFYYA